MLKREIGVRKCQHEYQQSVNKKTFSNENIMLVENIIKSVKKMVSTQ